MKKLLLFIFLFTIGTQGISQDIDIYSKKKNNNYELPNLNPQMSFEEFHLLSQNLRMQDMAFAVIVPGYVHFKAKDPMLGYSLLGLRSLAYAGLGYVLLDESFSLSDLINNKQALNALEQSNFDSQKSITYISLGIVITTYLFDWIHGKYRLEKKREMIRYKYGIKLNMSYTPSPLNPKAAIPTIGLNYSF